MLVSCHSSRVVSHVIIHSARPLPPGVNKGHLTSTSGTSPAHLGDGCCGYRPGALRVHPLWEACAVRRGSGGLQPGAGGFSGSSCPTSQSPHIWNSELSCHCVKPHLFSCIWRSVSLNFSLFIATKLNVFSVCATPLQLAKCRTSLHSCVLNPTHIKLSYGFNAGL